MKNILVVDDNPDVIVSLKTGLEDGSETYNVTGVQSGKQCLEHLKNNQPDIILLDIMMPQMSGWEVFDRIKENPPGIQFLSYFSLHGQTELQKMQVVF